jgi:D-cysteine desulfhydrase
VFATGAYGSNHAVATVLHGARLGFRSGALLFPQPFSRAAELNLQVSLGRADEIIGLWHWSALPLGVWQLARRQRRQQQPTLIMPPGGASPRGCLGFLSGALELGLQIDAAELPVPAEVILALGSTCSTAGLLVGLRVAARLGIGFKSAAGRPAPPLLVAVRVTPWPVTSKYRVLNLAERVARWLFQLTGDRVFELDRAELSQGLQLEGGYLGRGYGRPSPAGLAAIERLRPFSAALDTTYAAKSAAAALDRIRRGPACVRLFWSTKSGAALPEIESEALRAAPPRMQRWLAQAEPQV